MAKKVMHDVIPNEKRTIRRVSIDRMKRTNKNKDEKDTTEEKTEEHDEQPHEPILPPRPPRFRAERNARRFWVWGVAIVAILVLIAVVVSFAFSGAELTVTPKQESVVIDGQFRAEQEESIESVVFETVTLTRRAQREVEATGEAQVDTKASGEIIIFNNFDENPQRLITNTRFETPEGLIYRIPESVIVPGRHENEDGEIVPGSIEVTVFADSSGEEYNIGLTDFAIPGFEGDPRFFKFFARSKTPMTGGFSGIQKTVSEEDEERARETLQQDLEAQLVDAVESDIPEDMIVYPDTLFTSFRSLPNEGTEDEDTVNIVEEGTVRGFAFERAQLAEFIAQNTVASYDGGEVRFLNLEDLLLRVVDKETLEPVSATQFDFVLEGEGLVVWEFDEVRLREDLAGKSKEDLDMVLSGYSAIERAQVSIRPFWKHGFPNDSENIVITEVIVNSQ